MNRYRVTIPPFEVEAETSEEAERLADLRLDAGDHDFIIEDTTPLRPIGAEIRLTYTGDPSSVYVLDEAYTTHNAWGWSSTRWRLDSHQEWITARGAWSADQTRLITEQEAP